MKSFSGPFSVLQARVIPCQNRTMASICCILSTFQAFRQQKAGEKSTTKKNNKRSETRERKGAGILALALVSSRFPLRFRHVRLKLAPHNLTKIQRSLLSGRLEFSVLVNIVNIWTTPDSREPFCTINVIQLTVNAWSYTKTTLKTIYLTWCINLIHIAMLNY